jgi:molybdate transport system substrate-binding protein
MSFTRTKAMLLLLGMLATVVTLQADDVRVMTSGGFAAPHLDLVSPFERATRHHVLTGATSTGLGEQSIPSRVRRGDPVDGR